MTKDPFSVSSLSNFLESQHCFSVSPHLLNVGTGFIVCVRSMSVYHYGSILYACTPRGKMVKRGVRITSTPDTSSTQSWTKHSASVSHARQRLTSSLPCSYAKSDLRQMNTIFQHGLSIKHF